MDLRVPLAAAAFFGSTQAFALSGIQDLTQDMPFRVEDATPTPVGSLQLQTSLIYNQYPDRTEEARVEPNLQYGFLPWLQGTLSTAWTAGSVNKTGSADLLASLLIAPVPDWVALSVGVEFPTGVDEVGVQAGAKLIVSVPLDPSWSSRFHANVQSVHHFDAISGDRVDRFSLIVGYTRLISEDLLLGIDVAREQGIFQGSTSNIAQFGAVVAVGPFWSVAAALGTGLAEQSPNFNAVLGFQYATTGRAPPPPIR